MKKLDLDLLKEQVGEGKPGFVKFQNTPDQLFYFKYHHQDGQVLFFSHPHESAKKRDVALKNIKKYLTKLDRYKAEKEQGEWYFSIRAGNNREFARSLPFSSNKEMRSKLSELQEIFVRKPESTDGPENTSGMETLGQSEKHSQDERQVLSRFNFDLTFYRQAEDEPLIGKIEYPLHKQWETFEGLDFDKLEQFIRQHLPYEQMPKKQTVTALSPPSSIKKVPPPLYQVYFQERDRKLDGYLHLDQSTDLIIKLESAGAGDLDADTFSLVVKARSFGKNRKAEIIGRKAGKISSDGKVQVTLNTNNLDFGIYYLSFDLDLWPDQQAEIRQSVSGGRTVQLLKSWAGILN